MFLVSYLIAKSRHGFPSSPLLMLRLCTISSCPLRSPTNSPMRRQSLFFDAQMWHLTCVGTWPSRCIQGFTWFCMVLLCFTIFWWHWKELPGGLSVGFRWRGHLSPNPDGSWAITGAPPLPTWSPVLLGHVRMTWRQPKDNLDRGWWVCQVQREELVLCRSVQREFEEVSNCFYVVC